MPRSLAILPTSFHEMAQELRKWPRHYYPKIPFRIISHCGEHIKKHKHTLLILNN